MQFIWVKADRCVGAIGWGLSFTEHFNLGENVIDANVARKFAANKVLEAFARWGWCPKGTTEEEILEAVKFDWGWYPNGAEVPKRSGSPQRRSTSTITKGKSHAK